MWIETTVALKGFSTVLGQQHLIELPCGALSMIPSLPQPTQPKLWVLVHVLFWWRVESEFVVVFCAEGIDDIGKG